MEEIRVFRPQRNNTTRLLLAATLLLSLLMLVVFFLIKHPAHAHFGGWTPHAFSGQLGILLLLFAGLLGLCAEQRFSRNAVLRLDHNGIQLHSGLPKPLSTIIERRWPLRWSEVDHAQLRPAGLGKHSSRLRLISIDGKKRQLDLNRWQPQHYNIATTTEPAPTQTATLLQTLSQAGVRIEMESGSANAASERLQHRAVRLALFSIIAAGLYGVIDGFLIQTYQLIPPTPWLWWTAIGAIAGSIAWAFLAQSPLNRSQALSLALLVGGAFALAAYPGTMRTNALTAESITLTFSLGQTALNSEYEGTSLQIPIEGSFWRDPATPLYWELAVYQGALGFYQYNPEPIVEARQAYLQRDEL